MTETPPPSPAPAGTDPAQANPAKANPARTDVGLKGAANPNPNVGGAVHHDLYRVKGNADVLAREERKQARGMGLVFFAFFSLVIGGISMSFHHGLHFGPMASLHLLGDDDQPRALQLDAGSGCEVVWSDGVTTPHPEPMAAMDAQLPSGKVGLSLLVNDAWAGRLVIEPRKEATATALRLPNGRPDLPAGLQGLELGVTPGPVYAWFSAKLFHTVPTRIVVLVGAVFGVLGLLLPAALVPFNRFWMSRVAEPMGWFMTRVILSLFFFLFLTPYSLLVRLFAADPLRREKKPEGESYWLTRERQRERTHFQHPY